MRQIYLCSRVAKDAHPLNNLVADLLRASSYRVFVPHEQHYNQIIADRAHEVSDDEIYQQDMGAMLAAQACVIVGRVGVDCAFEVGWFQSRGIPVVWYVPDGCAVGRHPMLYTVVRVSTLAGVLHYLTATGRPPRDLKAAKAVKASRKSKFKLYDLPSYANRGVK